MNLPPTFSITPTAWLADQAITMVTNYITNHQNVTILEFGSGCSTAFFAQFRVHITSFEHHPFWYAKVQDYLTSNAIENVTHHFMKNPYYLACSQFTDESFDIIYVDGLDRIKCIEHTMRLVKPGGVLILDDAQHEKYNKAYELLKNWQLHSCTQEKANPVSGELQTAQTNWWIKP